MNICGHRCTILNELSTIGAPHAGAAASPRPAAARPLLAQANRLRRATRRFAAASLVSPGRHRQPAQGFSVSVPAYRSLLQSMRRAPGCWYPAVMLPGRAVILALAA